MTLPELHAIALENGLPLDAAALARLEQYSKLLLEWNAKINLISRKDEENLLARHVLHSLVLRMPAICPYDFHGRSVADVGTGGGLPGIPLALVTPSVELTLIDSVQKKITACTQMAQALGLPDVRTVAGRAEDLARGAAFAGAFDVIVTRAVAPLEDLTKWTLGLLRPGGTLLSLKGGDLAEELKRTRRIAAVLEAEETPLQLFGYDEFEREGKKLVRVLVRS